MEIEPIKCNYEYNVNDHDYEYICTTPKHDGCRIPVSIAPPPPPKKKRYYFGKKRVEPPKNGYFNIPDLELVFTPRVKEACA